MKKLLNKLFIFILIVNTINCNSEPVEDENIEDTKPELFNYPVLGGYQQPHYLGTTDAPYGHFLFTPESAINSEQKYPLLIFLHGYGERGDSKANQSNLNKILAHGPCKIIKNGNWNPSTEMFVASPQCHGGWWNRDLIKQFIEYMISSNDQVDTSRIYLTGLSMGGFATFDLLCSFGEESKIAAAVPICGKGELSEEGNLNLSKIPLWVFHGDADGTVSPEYSKTIVPTINEINPTVPAKHTIYPGVGHDSWTMTYSGSGMGKEDANYDAFDMDIYTWMNQFKKIKMKNFLYIAIAVFIAISCTAEDKVKRYKPVIDGEWWSITTTPDLGEEYNTDKQEPVDFGVWQADDGTWQLWSCIRYTKCGGNTRLLYAWEGKSLTDTAWTPKGIAMMADTTLGERRGGIQAPYVMKEDGIYYMFYGGWDQVCLASSTDGKSFKRVINESGTAELFRGPMTNTRDAMVIKEGDTYYCYYSVHDLDRSLEEIQAAIFVRKSKDLKEWSDPIMVSGGGKYEKADCWGGGDAECPFVVKIEDQYVMFRNVEYGKGSLNAQYCSSNSEYFGIAEDSLLVGEMEIAAPEIVHHNGQYYIVCLKKSLDGMRVAKLKWEEIE